MADCIRILFLADTHLGFDLPTQPRVVRRRRGHDFLANYARALAPALAGEVDLVVHGGDVFQRSRVAPSVAYQAFAPLVRVADRGVPVFVVPGNHERSHLPHGRFAHHGGIHVFDRPRTYVVTVRGARLALAGFPFQRQDIRTRFPAVLRRTGWNRGEASRSVLCMHQCVEGATVGPADHVFTSAADVVRGRDIPPGFAGVLSGHIHRHQVLTMDLRGRPLAAPVLYPGSIERTALAELGEAKGFLVVEVPVPPATAALRWRFRELPARPMLVRDLHAGGLDPTALESAVRALVTAAPEDAVLRIRVFGRVAGSARRVLAASHLRSVAPATMNVEIRADEAGNPGWHPVRQRAGRERRVGEPGGEVSEQLELG